MIQEAKSRVKKYLDSPSPAEVFEKVVYWVTASLEMIAITSTFLIPPLAVFALAKYLFL